MAQHDFAIDNAPGLTVRTDINAALAAIQSSSSGPVEPVVKAPGQVWFDTSTPAVMRLALRDQANATWLNVMLPTGATMTGPLTPSPTAGIVGVTDGSSANAGSVGEVISANITAGVSLTTGIAANIASIALTAGDWDVGGEVWFALGTGGAAGIHAAINTVSATLPGTSSLATTRNTLNLTSFLASAGQFIPLRNCRVNLTTTTTYYLIATCNFASGTCTATGNIIARRRR